MRRLKICLLVLFTLSLFASCSDDEKIEGLRSNQILVVTLKIIDKIEINKISLNSNYGTDEISANDIGEKRKVKLKVPQKGEGTFSICIFTETNTLCSDECYVEGGYRPVMMFKDGKFEIIDFF